MEFSHLTRNVEVSPLCMLVLLRPLSSGTTTSSRRPLACFLWQNSHHSAQETTFPHFKLYHSFLVHDSGKFHGCGWW